MTKHSDLKQGSLFGGALLITGSCVGAGMLGLPILTGIAGFLPTLAMFLISWLFMTATALLLVETSSSFQTPVNFLTMVGRSLGRVGKMVGWLLYLFLFYALIVAYLSGSGHHTALLVKNITGYQIPLWAGGLFFVALFGWIVFLGTKSVDIVNRGLMFAKIAAYFVLVVTGVLYVNPTKLLYADAQYAFFSLPILIISFGFHNMIPSLYSYLGGDVKRIKKSIFYGSFFTFIIYIFWEIVVLGILPVKGAGGILESYHKDIGGAQAIRVYLGANSVGVFAEILAFFAILTSFLAQSLSLVHFLSDGFKLKAKKRESFFMCLLALIPPALFSLFFPQLFFGALNFAGGFCAVILFGVMPALMVWIGRYRHKIPSDYQFSGGQPLLISLLIFSVFILFYQACVMLGINIFPIP